MNLTEGQILDGKYRIVRQIGEGGMGAVFQGENIRVKKMVAIKVLHARPSGVDDAVQRFEREAQAAGQIGSDHIVEVHDLGKTPDGDHFMVMEYLEGESLRERIHRGQTVEPQVIAPIITQLLDGLAAAHEAGIIHRDLKPDNVFILHKKAGRKDFVKILDFGISKFLQIGQTGGTTQTGVVMGSPNYMSPEQVKSSHEVDQRSDLYTVGVILYEAVTGRVPFKANTFAELLFKIVYEPLPDPRIANPKLDDAFADLIVKACASKREDRFQSAAELKAALERFMPAGYRSIPAPRRPTPLAVQAVRPLEPMLLDLGSGTVAMPIPHAAAPPTSAGPPIPPRSSPGQSGGGFTTPDSQSGGFAVQASESGRFGTQASQSGGFVGQANQSGGAFSAQANQSGDAFSAQASQSGGFAQASQSGGHAITGGGSFSSTLGPGHPAVDSNKKSRAPMLLGLMGLFAIAAAATGFFVLRSQHIDSASPPKTNAAAEKTEAASTAPTEPTAMATASAAASPATSADASPSPPSASPPSASATSSASSGATANGAAPAASSTTKVPPHVPNKGWKRPGSDVLGY